MIMVTEVTADIITYKKKTVFCSGQNSVMFLLLTGTTVMIWNYKDSDTGNDLFNPDYDKSSVSITSSTC